MSPTTCIQCMMEALLDEPPRPAPIFAESPAEHMRLVHPDPDATLRRRRELELELEKRLATGTLRISK